MSPVAKLVSDTAARLLLTPATVGAITEHDRFRTIELVGERLTGTDWVPGDKVRIHVDGLTLRTYTPFAWDRETGSTQLLAYLPGAGPGATWCDTARSGDPCSLLGPKRSVQLDRVTAPPVLVGDETSFGLFLAWQRSRPDAPPADAIFEVTSAAVSGAVLAAHGVEDAARVALIERTPDDAHLEALADRLVSALRGNPDAPLLLTGCAQTIAALRRRLKSVGLARRADQVKAYWDQHRKGLD